MLFVINKVLSLFFRLLYHPFAWTYDLVSGLVSFGRWPTWVSSSIPFLQGPNILELGHGPGHLQASLIGLGYAPVGLDESKQMSRLAQRRLKKTAGTWSAADPHSIRLVNGRAEHLPFTRDYFQTVVATFPTQYIFDPVTLTEVQRVLSPDGRLVVLLAAWIVGGSLIDRGLALLFRVTGESPDVNMEFIRFLQPFQAAGFHAELKWIETNSSKLLFICANKS
ncbi:MAG: methyltransferase domain-containing protein [Anaerolineaceae bacterium]|nr:methyltransferase domain-containing protein [Anaerolineaceae bacterium]